MDCKPNVRKSIYCLEIGESVEFSQTDVRPQYARSVASTLGTDYNRLFAVKAIKGSGKITVTRIS